MLSLALIGCGHHARTAHAPALAYYAARHPGEIRLVAACDTQMEQARRFCAQFGFERAYADWEQMVDTERPDGVLAILPVPLIVEHSTRLLERGIPLVIEKPPGATRQEACALAEAARRTGTTHMVSVNRRFVPRLNRAIAWANEQGPLQYARCSMLRDRRVEEDFAYSTGIHTIDALRHIAGNVTGWRLQTRHRAPLSARWHLIDLEFASGAVGRLDMLPTAGSLTETYELTGENFRAELITRLPSGTESILRCWKNDNLLIEDQTPGDEPACVTRGEYHELAEFVAAIRERRSTRPMVDDVLPSMELASAIYAAGQAAAPCV